LWCASTRQSLYGILALKVDFGVAMLLQVMQTNKLSSSSLRSRKLFIKNGLLREAPSFDQINDLAVRTPPSTQKLNDITQVKKKKEDMENQCGQLKRPTILSASRVLQIRNVNIPNDSNSRALQPSHLHPAVVPSTDVPSQPAAQAAAPDVAPAGNARVRKRKAAAKSSSIEQSANSSHQPAAFNTVQPAKACQHLRRDASMRRLLEAESQHVLNSRAVKRPKIPDTASEPVKPSIEPEPANNLDLTALEALDSSSEDNVESNLDSLFDAETQFEDMLEEDGFDQDFILGQQERRYHIDFDFLRWQPFITTETRRSLIWEMLSLHAVHRLTVDCYFLAASLFDRFLQKHAVREGRAAHVLATCLLIASKFETCRARGSSTNPYHWILKFPIAAPADRLTMETVVNLEVIILQSLEYSVSFPTMLPFLFRLHNLAASSNQLDMVPKGAQSFVLLTSIFIGILCLVEAGMLKWKVGLVAHATVVITHAILGLPALSLPNSRLINHSTAELRSAALDVIPCIATFVHAKAREHDVMALIFGAKRYGQVMGLLRKACASRVMHQAIDSLV